MLAGGGKSCPLRHLLGGLEGMTLYSFLASFNHIREVSHPGWALLLDRKLSGVSLFSFFLGFLLSLAKRTAYGSSRAGDRIQAAATPDPHPTVPGAGMEPVPPQQPELLRRQCWILNLLCCSRNSPLFSFQPSSYSSFFPDFDCYFFSPLFPMKFHPPIFFFLID